MRTIDADNLLKTLRSIKYIGADPVTVIQNAEISRCMSFVETEPTIEETNDDDRAIQYSKGFQDGFLTAKEQAGAKQGKWIPSEETYTDLSGTIETYTRFKCDQCLQGQNFGPYPFCPWCGADMKPKEEEQRT